MALRTRLLSTCDSRSGSATATRPSGTAGSSSVTLRCWRASGAIDCASWPTIGASSTCRLATRSSWASARASISRSSTSKTRIPIATWTTCPTGRAKPTSRWRCRTRSGSAATTRPSSSRLTSRTRRERREMANQLDFKELQDLAAEILGVDADQVQMDKSFARDLAADSLDLVELIAAVEDKYDVELPESELEKMKVIADLWT